MSEVIFIVGAIVLFGASLLPWLLTRFDYAVNDHDLVITMYWSGVVPVRKSIAISEIRAIRRVNRKLEIWPIFSGTFPTLWGKMKIARMVVIQHGASDFFPLLITPDDPEDLVARVKRKQLELA